MSQRQDMTAAAAISPQASRQLAPRPNPYMMHSQFSPVTGAQLAPPNLGGPSATQRKGIINLFPKQFSELRRDIDFPQIRDMVSNIHPTEGEACRPRAPFTTKIGRLITHNRVYNSAVDDRTGQKGQRLMIQYRTIVHPIGRNRDGC